ncbi:MAG: NifU family protein [Spirochaetaceae bacterium]|nr:NifU family protein [Spirochaetaceae bacterium]
MPREILDKIETVLDERIRPLLRQHNGDAAIESLEEGVLRVRMIGGCVGCPSAVSEIEQLAGEEITSRFPEVRSVVVITGVSDELIEAARALLRQKHTGQK